ncbi:MAG: DUF4139 domain-containing protein [Synergistales bacterium]|nr:DUF4139 domain-containing protein [Synergistales bacterium]
MSRYPFTLIMALTLTTLISVPAQAGEIILRQIDFYPGEAKLTYQVEAGDHIKLELPGAFDPSTIGFTSSPGAEVYFFEVKENHRTNWIPPSLKDLFNNMASMDQEICSLSSDLAAFHQTAGFLDKFTTSTLQAEDVFFYLDKIEEKRSDTESAILNTSRILDRKRKELEILRSTIEENMPVNSDRVVSVEIKSSGTGNIYIQAWTEEAGWEPYYRIHLDTLEQTMNFGIKARTFQKTGIDFEGPILFHSTSPEKNIACPEIEPLPIDLEDIKAPVENRKHSLPYSDNILDPRDNLRILTGVTDLITSSSGRIQGKGTPVLIDLGSENLDVSVDMEIVPFLSPNAWVTATLEKTLRPIMEGTAELRMDGKIIGDFFLPFLMRGEKLKIPFGNSPLITAFREETVPTMGSNGSDLEHLEVGYRIKLKNGLSRETPVRLTERLPYPTSGEIIMDLLDIEPEPDLDHGHNLLSWDFHMTPGEQQEIYILYRISYPAYREIGIR